MKRVLAIHDISCFGKCSLTVALPIVSASGLECTVLPNVLLSAHTGIPGFTYLDLTDQMRPIMDHWHNLGLEFDCIFTGFLSDKEQIDIVCDTIDVLRKKDEAMIFVDPAMADNGVLYPVFEDEFPMQMRDVCARADVIKPNITEACLMTGTAYHDGPYTEEYIDGLLKGLKDIGAGKVILTGVHYDSEELGAIAYDCVTGEKEFFAEDRIPGEYVGTGDIFSSVAASALTKGLGFHDAVELAVEFTAACIRRTYKEGTDPADGVNFEEEIPLLVDRLNRGSVE